jgi:fatty-acyl-CoA synthase
MPSAFDGADLAPTPANHVALSPTVFLPKAARIHPALPAIVYGERRTDWAETYARCRRLAAALAGLGVGRGDTVSVLSPNTPPMCELHYAVPMLGAVLHTLNTRLDADAIAFQLAHGQSAVLFTDREYSAVIARALAALPADRRPVVIDIDDPAASSGERLGVAEYEAFLAGGAADFAWSAPGDEWDALSLNYTSGTTGDPKGVVGTHRGAYLNAINNVFTADVRPHAAYLWTVPMFHCNGWCFPWTLAAVAGVNVCLRRVEAGAMYDAIRRHKVTQMSGAPIVYGMLITAPDALRAGIAQRVTGTIGGAAPPSATMMRAEAVGIDLVHIYGLTETYGPAAVCARQGSWAALPAETRAGLAARQGFATLMQEEMRVADPTTLEEVPHDGATVGEIMFRGNVVMKGYLKNPKATQASFDGGWFHSGDLAVVEPDGYVRVRDRSKDVIISGGENISSIEVEDVLSRHPAVGAAAVVAAPHPKWGETPCAFIEVRDGMAVSEADLRAFARQHLAGYKLPGRIVFGAIPRTATGKAQKYLLRTQVNADPPAF